MRLRSILLSLFLGIALFTGLPEIDAQPTQNFLVAALDQTTRLDTIEDADTAYYVIDRVLTDQGDWIITVETVDTVSGGANAGTAYLDYLYHAAGTWTNSKSGTLEADPADAFGLDGNVVLTEADISPYKARVRIVSTGTHKTVIKVYARWVPNE